MNNIYIIGWLNNFLFEYFMEIIFYRVATKLSDFNYKIYMIKICCSRGVDIVSVENESHINKRRNLVDNSIKWMVRYGDMCQ